MPLLLLLCVDMDEDEDDESEEDEAVECVFHGASPCIIYAIE